MIYIYIQKKMYNFLFYLVNINISGNSLVNNFINSFEGFDLLNLIPFKYFKLTCFF